MSHENLPQYNFINKNNNGCNDFIHLETREKIKEENEIEETLPYFAQENFSNDLIRKKSLRDNKRNIPTGEFLLY